MKTDCHNSNPYTPIREAGDRVDCPMNFFRTSGTHFLHFIVKFRVISAGLCLPEHMSPIDFPQFILKFPLIFWGFN